MIGPACRSQSATDGPPAWHAGFLAMLPVIERCARVAFRGLPTEAREEAVEEVIANVMVAYVRLFELKKTEVAHPTILARFGIAQTRDGRRVGGRLNVRDVLSKYAQRNKRFVVHRLDYFDKEENEWTQAVVEDHQTPVPEQVAFRIDFPTWLAILPRRDRRIATTLAVGHTTSHVAQRFQVSQGRISQMRRELYGLWQMFHGETPLKNKAA